VRAKARIRETPIPYEVPTPQELPERLDAVLQVMRAIDATPGNVTAGCRGLSGCAG